LGHTAHASILPPAARVSRWTPEKAEDLYHVPSWGSGYFFVNEAGHVAVRPIRGQDLSIDLHEVVERLRERGIRYPALIRFQDLLKSRVEHLNESFRQAIADTGYQNRYQGVFPIKVNQLREVVEEILDAGKPYNYGLECGSKSELVATLPYLEAFDTLLLCNGCKDDAMMRLMLAGQQLGKNILPILERYEEYEMLLRPAREMDIPTQFGVRVRLTTAGAGLWSESGGENSKFGISLTELIKLVDELKAEAHPAALRLLHFHLGSQIADVEKVRQAIEEAAQVYAWLHRQGITVEYLDIGGGLGVNYEADNPEALGYINYNLDDYTHTVVSAMKEACDRAGVPHPVIVSESGRAITAHHSVLIVQVLGARVKDVVESLAGPVAPHPLLAEMSALLDHLQAHRLTLEALQEAFAAAEALRAQVTDTFRQGDISLEQKARFERLYWSACFALNERAHHLVPGDLPPSLATLDRQLVDHYLCDFSIFRSLIDHWAIGQRFPIMPIHRLDEAPTRRGTLADLTCDSDGQVKDFVSPEGDRHFLELHRLNPDQPYYLGFFLMGAYQDIMGDMHNLFGRVTEVHVYADEEEPGDFYVEEILKGATIEEQLAMVQYYPNDLERRMASLIQQQVKAGRVRPHAGVQLLEQYRRAFRDYTYLNMDGGT
jgi:arginine decarboxylase